MFTAEQLSVCQLCLKGKLHWSTSNIPALRMTDTRCKVKISLLPCCVRRAGFILYRLTVEEETNTAMFKRFFDAFQSKKSKPGFKIIQLLTNWMIYETGCFGFLADQDTAVDQPQTSAPEKANETEPREDPLGEESREIVQEIPAENVTEKKADDDQELVNQAEGETSKDEGVVQDNQAVNESTAPKDEGDQLVKESEEEAGTSEEAPAAETSGEDKTVGEHAGEQSEAEKPAEEGAVGEGETEGQKESEQTAQVDEEKPSEGENAEEAQSAVEQSQPTDEETPPADSESQPAAEESSPAAEEQQAEEPSGAGEGQKSEDAQPQEETPASEDS